MKGILSYIETVSCIHKTTSFSGGSTWRIEDLRLPGRILRSTRYSGKWDMGNGKSLAENLSFPRIDVHRRHNNAQPITRNQPRQVQNVCACPTGTRDQESCSQCSPLTCQPAPAAVKTQHESQRSQQDPFARHCRCSKKKENMNGCSQTASCASHRHIASGRFAKAGPAGP